MGQYNLFSNSFFKASFAKKIYGPLWWNFVIHGLGLWCLSIIIQKNQKENIIDYISGERSNMNAQNIWMKLTSVTSISDTDQIHWSDFC